MCNSSACSKPCIKSHIFFWVCYAIFLSLNNLSGLSNWDDRRELARHCYGSNIRSIFPEAVVMFHVASSQNMNTYNAPSGENHDHRHPKWLKGPIHKHTQTCLPWVTRFLPQNFNDTSSRLLLQGPGFIVPWATVSKSLIKFWILPCFAFTLTES